MTEDDLVNLFEQRGYICVRTPGRYHAISVTDIMHGKIKENARSVVEASAFVLDETKVQDMTQFIDRALATHTPGREIDTNRTHTILTGKRQAIPEWNGWDVKTVRQLLKIDKEQ